MGHPNYRALSIILPLQRDTLFFLCSSRRRHTRCYRDWSSDVCSSDLLELPFALPPLVEARRAPLLPLLVELAVVLAATAVGTGIATGADALAGPVDGRPAAYFLVLLALPLWELMPLPPLLRMGTAAAAWCAVASVWYLFAMASQDLWWRGEGAFGAACLVVGWAAVLAVWQFWVEPDVP